jgi:hypothetical protein
MAARWRIALVCCALILALGSIAPACANFGVPSACLPVCDGASESEPCQQCLDREAQKREEARRQREEARRQAPPPSTSGGGGSGGGY